MKMLRDRFWIWGHPKNCFYELGVIDRESDKSYCDGMEYLGAKNIFFVPMDFKVDKEKETALAKNVAELGWSINCAAAHPENVTEIAELKKKYANIRIGIFDDFFNEENKANNYHLYTPEKMAEFREELHRAGLEMWMVLYTKNFSVGMDVVKSFIKEFDGISFWFWERTSHEDIDRNIDIFLELAKEKKKLVGCYLYDFDKRAPTDSEIVLYQLDKYKELIKKNEIEGVILHTNGVIAKGEQYEAVAAARDWMQKNGDEEI